MTYTNEYGFSYGQDMTGYAKPEILQDYQPASIRSAVFLSYHQTISYDLQLDVSQYDIDLGIGSGFGDLFFSESNSTRFGLDMDGRSIDNYCCRR